MKVLLGTDGSDHAVGAARALTLLAADEVLVACVVAAPAAATAGLESGFAGGLASADQIDRAWADVHAEAQRAIDRTTDALTAAASVDAVVVDGDPGATLCQLAEERAADVIVVGSRGLGAIRRALLGSVSTYVVNNAPCAVLVVPAESHD